ncbi:MAG: DUF3892 domain-containing protein [Photobacterium aquimaris]|nr:DUF3892 domain-containing protein [Photobacterium aquimaris]
MAIYLTAKKSDEDDVLIQFKGYNTDSLSNNCINSQTVFDKKNIEFALIAKNNVYTEVIVNKKQIHQDVHLICDGEKMYLRTDANNIKADNLSNLPNF